MAVVMGAGAAGLGIASRSVSSGWRLPGDGLALSYFRAVPAGLRAWLAVSTGDSSSFTVFAFLGSRATRPSLRLCEWGADALGEPAPKPGAGWVSSCGWAGEEQPQIPRSAYPAKGGGAPGVRPFDGMRTLARSSG